MQLYFCRRNLPDIEVENITADVIDITEKNYNRDIIIIIIIIAITTFPVSSNLHQS